MPSACALVTRADVEHLLLRRVRIGQEQSAAGESTCDYAGRYGQVTVTVQRLHRKLNVEEEIESLKEAIPGSTVRPLSGIGTTAFFLEIGDDGTQLHVIRGETDYLLVSVLGFGNASRVSRAAEEMARRAIERM